MAHRNANFGSQAAARLTALAHTQASVIRWGVVIALTLVWIVGGLFYWTTSAHRVDWAEAAYRTISAVGMWDEYFRKVGASGELDPMLQVVRFAAVARARLPQAQGCGDLAGGRTAGGDGARLAP
jgi:hypothetical protein